MLLILYRHSLELFCQLSSSFFNLYFHIKGKYTFDELPYIIFGSLSLLAAVVVYFVPETFGKNLPNTIEEIEGTTVKDNNVELLDY